MLENKIPPSLKNFFITTVVISVICGGLVGGASGVLLAGVSSRIFWPKIEQTFGFSDTLKYGTESNQSEKIPVVEDSATVSVAEQVSPSVVSIIVTKKLSNYYNRTGQMSPFEEFFFFGSPFYPEEYSESQQVSGGTGFIITTDGMIVTNRHVVQYEDAEYTIILSDGKQYDARVLARDDINDIAIIKIQADNLPVLDMGDSDQIKIGQTVIAIGNTLGEYQNTVTKGVISGINRRVVAGVSYGNSEVIDEAIQTDAAINPGNSGGPLLDLFGKAIGVNTAVSSEGQLIGFAIPINSVKRIVESVRENGRIVRPFIGVRYILLNSEIAKANNIENIDYGALIIRGETRTDLAVMPGSPADKAGIMENDIILEVNGEKINDKNNLAKIISKYKPGEKILLKIYHKAQEKEVSLVLEERK